jgi:hypothetical protein
METPIAYRAGDEPEPPTTLELPAGGSSIRHN